MSTRIGRVALAAGFATALATTSGCGMPAQPDPRPGGATLSEDIIAYDHPEFRTDRDPIMAPGKECDVLTESLLTRMKLDSLGEGEQDDFGAPGCRFELSDGSIMVSASPQPFGKYWRSDVTGTQTPGAMFGGPSSLKRTVLGGKFYAVEYTVSADNPAGACYTAVDIGSRYPIVVTADPVNDTNAPDAAKRASLGELRKTHCPLASKLAVKLITTIDPGAGSRAS